jgi:hypothetical protein
LVNEGEQVEREFELTRDHFRSITPHNAIACNSTCGKVASRAGGGSCMFRTALATAYKFTLPVLLSRKTIGGRCEGAVGTCVVINRDGWIVTAAHLLRQWNQLQADVQAARDYPNLRKSIEDDQTIERHERKRRIAALRPPGAESSDQCSAFWGLPGATLVESIYAAVSAPGWDEVADIGIGRLEPFDSGLITGYPKFKRDGPDVDDAGPGTSLCRLGFPFSAINPTWNGIEFVLPPIPFIRFPIEGMITRIMNIQLVDPAGIQSPLPFPIKYIETSSPGLKGQSGGPMFDVNGVVWAIQAKTLNLPLGFDAQVPGKKGQTEHQFLNVGIGVHPSTLLGTFRSHNVNFELADY